jgi:hypothetical protein
LSTTSIRIRHDLSFSHPAFYAPYTVITLFSSYFAYIYVVCCVVYIKILKKTAAFVFIDCLFAHINSTRRLYLCFFSSRFSSFFFIILYKPFNKIYFAFLFTFYLLHLLGNIFSILTLIICIYFRVRVKSKVFCNLQATQNIKHHHFLEI